MILKPSREFEGSALVACSVLSAAAFIEYVQSLAWGSGHRDESSWSAFLRAASLGIAPETAVEVVTKSIRATGGTFNPSKLQSQVRRAYAHVTASEPGFVNVSKMPKASFSPEKLKAAAAKVTGIDAQYLQSHSPISAQTTSAQFLEHLYQPGEKIVVFTHFESQGQFIYEIGAEPRVALPLGAPDGVWFLANPVDGKYHLNPRHEYKRSRRSEESVTCWRYLVLESDVADTNDWLACLVQLPLKIVAIYTSGGKSIHALVRLDAVSKQHWDQERDLIRPIVVTLGADAQAMTAVRLSRLPCSLRGGIPQELLYLDPQADGSPIISKVNVRDSRKD